ncbi:hypothetical protein [Thermoflavimicrobium dichotomicum]|uniref:Uncharacterized protein n=1 Tax=Thermoflavimicrobium dichotomicum TaxID=46223 RepID=A0A1I3R7B1_9BACL|nr:hypothetical protein [Thermoflavimicrobium dichotomicum]SFJ42503.1 hypothetical protein SAMN05421852_10969 [Thermoflavimicrobium dichotomicum]
MKKLLGIILVIILALGAMFIPLPSYIGFEPGDLYDGRDVVSVDGVNKKEEKGFYLTSVYVGPATVFDYLLDKVSVQIAVKPVEQVTGGKKQKLDDQMMQEIMQAQEAGLEKTTANTATIAAFRQAKKPITVKEEGMEVIKPTGLSNPIKPNAKNPFFVIL